MKKVLFLVIFSSCALIGKAQDASVEKSIFGIQTGFLGVWAHNESRLSNQISLRTELGLDAGIWWGGLNVDVEFLMTPVITLEPRWYYNLNRREAKSKRIDGNSGNFLSLKTSYHPDWFVISDNDNVNISNQIGIIPTWGIRRNIGKHFNYETGIGVGYEYVFAKGANVSKDYGDIAINLHLRIGYRF